VIDWVALIIVGLLCYFIVGFLSYLLGKLFMGLSDTTELPKKLHASWEAGTYNTEVLIVYLVSFVWLWYHWHEKSLPKIIKTIRADVARKRGLSELVLLFVFIFMGYKIFFIVLDHIL
jgi:hypothetical protein